MAIRFSDGRKTYVHTVVRDGQTSTIASRYSRFVWLDHEVGGSAQRSPCGSDACSSWAIRPCEPAQCQVRRAYKGNHLLSNVPKLPKKKWKALVRAGLQPGHPTRNPS